MADDAAKPEMKKLLELWVSADLKIQVIMFYHNNPGIVDTVEGLATRLGVSVDALRQHVADHVRLGLLKEQAAGQHKVLVYDRAREQDVQKFIEESIKETLRRKGVA